MLPRLGFVVSAYVFRIQFASQEEKRQKNERLHQHQKHENQMRDLQLQCDSNIRELQELQVRTRHCVYILQEPGFTSVN